MTITVTLAPEGSFSTGSGGQLDFVIANDANFAATRVARQGIFGPTTFRDGSGWIVRGFTTPIGYIPDVPLRNTLWGIGAVDLRAQALQAESIVGEAALDPYTFIRRGNLDDTYRIAETLADDPDELVGKAVGWMLREAGKRDPERLAGFLEPRAATMPRSMLRYAIEKLDKPERDRYLAMKRR